MIGEADVDDRVAVTAGAVGRRIARSDDDVDRVEAAQAIGDAPAQSAAHPSHVHPAASGDNGGDHAAARYMEG